MKRILISRKFENDYKVIAFRRISCINVIATQHLISSQNEGSLQLAFVSF